MVEQFVMKSSEKMQTKTRKRIKIACQNSVTHL